MSPIAQPPPIMPSDKSDADWNKSILIPDKVLDEEKRLAPRKEGSKPISLLLSSGRKEETLKNVQEKKNPFRPFLDQQGCVVLDGGLSTALPGHAEKHALWGHQLLYDNRRWACSGTGSSLLARDCDKSGLEVGCGRFSERWF